VKAFWNENVKVHIYAVNYCIERVVYDIVVSTVGLWLGGPSSDVRWRLSVQTEILGLFWSSRQIQR
jgi:hypothetical protein